MSYSRTPQIPLFGTDPRLDKPTGCENRNLNTCYKATGSTKPDIDVHLYVVQ